MELQKNSTLKIMKRKLKIKKEIDYGIKTFVKDLNEHGYKTLRNYPLTTSIFYAKLYSIR
jgi:hypothetical protein